MAEIVTKERVSYRIWDKVNSKWNELKFKTNANSVDANDGDNMETKVGAIKGITTSTDVTEEGYAADATTVAALNSNLNKILEDGLMKKIMFTKLYLTEVSNTNNPTFTIENLNIGDIILFLAYGYSTNFSSITGGHIITLFNEDEPLYFIIEATDTTVVVNGYKSNTVSPLTFVSAYKIEDVNVVDE